jgi:peptidoglycan/xylan/chitin deacetylase (PgdA/CDA1 family)
VERDSGERRQQVGLDHRPRQRHSSGQKDGPAPERKGPSLPGRWRRRIAVGGAILALLIVVAAAGALLHGSRRVGSPSVAASAHRRTTTSTAPLTKTTVLPPASSFPPRVFSNLDVLLPAPLPAAARALRIPILAYHLIDTAPPSPFQGPKALEMTVSTKSFDRQMTALRAMGYHTVTPYQVYRAMAGLAPLPPRPLALTFDDGYRDNYTNVFPVLRRYGFTATFFVITGKVGRQGYMSWAELREMSAAGMLIESHTVTHPVLTRIPLPAVERELVQSRQALWHNLGIDARVLCYPYGTYNSSVIGAARAAGYVMAFTTRAGLIMEPQAIFALPRVPVGHHERPAAFLRSLGH